MFEASAAIFNLLCNTIRESRCLTEGQKSILTKMFGSRFTSAHLALEEGKVKKYVFYPSGRVLWIVSGKEHDYQILPLANFCSCFDFYFRVIGYETLFCYHLITQKLADALEKYIEIDDQLENLPRGEKRTKLCHELFKIRALDFSGIDFSEIGSDQTSDNFTN